MQIHGWEIALKLIQIVLFIYSRFILSLTPTPPLSLSLFRFAVNRNVFFWIEFIMAVEESLIEYAIFYVVKKKIRFFTPLEVSRTRGNVRSKRKTPKYSEVRCSTSLAQKISTMLESSRVFVWFLLIDFSRIDRNWVYTYIFVFLLSKYTEFLHDFSKLFENMLGLFDKFEMLNAKWNWQVVIL